MAEWKGMRCRAGQTCSESWLCDFLPENAAELLPPLSLSLLRAVVTPGLALRIIARDTS